ncbi:hypothetical protein LDO26_16805 [Luteimonas sp. BDR2-5]|uniref:hypothetical protein n=1 Tax=Proluteimonas luteida TaxID=2878685 RepID=UPI001E42FDAA|nr:hypothetical protein [Luteimonas sp. BDR2-5]MCD9029852.1 hypothetical protein [Luteimonas sp. BDR2-5]
MSAGAPGAGPQVPTPAGALAIAGYGDDALAALAAIDVEAALDASPAAVLVQRLGALHLAMRADDARGLRRKVGLIGRLLGRDVALQADADALAARIGVLLRDVDRAADALATHAAAQQACIDAVEAGCARLAQVEAEGQARLDAMPAAADTLPGDAAAQLARRLDHLRTVLTTHALTARQLALLRAQSTALLARHRNIRDVLVPAWRQRALGAGAVAGAVQARDAAAIEAQIASELAGMTATLDSHGPVHGPDQETAA